MLLDNGDLKELFDLRFQMADSTPILRIGPLNLAQELFSVFSIRKSGLILEIQLMGCIYYIVCLGCPVAVGDSEITIAFDKFLKS